MTKRQRFTLSETEIAQWKKLCGRRYSSDKKSCPELWNFWGQVALARGLDYATLLYDGNAIYSGLPMDYKGPWCAPWPLQCENRP